MLISVPVHRMTKAPLRVYYASNVVASHLETPFNPPHQNKTIVLIILEVNIKGFDLMLNFTTTDSRRLLIMKEFRIVIVIVRKYNTRYFTCLPLRVNL